MLPGSPIELVTLQPPLGGESVTSSPEEGTTPALRRRTTVSLGDMRLAGGLMLAAAAMRPVVPGGWGLPCPLRSLTGLPCPLCGMTRSVTAAVHLRLAEAVALNPAGVAAVILAIALLALRRIGPVAVPVWAPPGAIALLWAWQLWRFPLT